MPDCPICATSAPSKREPTPYWVCPGCGLYFQDPLPPKLYHGPEEPDVDGYSDGDKEINRALARSLYERHLKRPEGVVYDEPPPLRTLDIGAKIPFLASCFHDLGCEAFAIDPTCEEKDWQGVHCIALDFESSPLLSLQGIRFGLITLIHVFEHFSRPLDALRKLRQLTAVPHGRVFLRIPDSNVNGFERDFTPHHYSIHPYIHSIETITEMLARLGDAFTVERMEIMPGYGQRDITLRPL